MVERKARYPGVVRMLSFDEVLLDSAMSAATTPMREAHPETLDQAKESQKLVNSDFETAVQQEYHHLSKVHPTSNDIPTCFSLFQLMLGCNGEIIASITSFFQFISMFVRLFYISN